MTTETHTIPELQNSILRLSNIKEVSKSILVPTLTEGVNMLRKSPFTSWLLNTVDTGDIIYKPRAVDAWQIQTPETLHPHLSLVCTPASNGLISIKVRRISNICDNHILWDEDDPKHELTLSQIRFIYYKEKALGLAGYLSDTLYKGVYRPEKMQVYYNKYMEYLRMKHGTNT